MSDYALVLNAGSSSLKFSVYHRAPDTAWEPAGRGQIGGIGGAARLVARDRKGAVVEDRALGAEAGDGGKALAVLAGWLGSHYTGARLLAVGHRVVHGGTEFAGPIVVTAEVLDKLRALIPLAPLHQPHNIAAIEAVREHLPEVPQVACFDTSFHLGQPALARVVPLPADIRRRGVQRYGFHGLSYEYIASILPLVAPPIAHARVVVAHLGNGASVCAMRDGKSVDSSFGFTALDGLCMGTRPGALDPGVVLYLFQGLGLSADEVETILYERSGLLALSGIGGDMRELLASPSPDAALAIDYFVYRAAKEIAALAAVLEGADAIVFTAGIGENSVEIRRRIGAACRWLGVEIDAAANERHGPRISTPASRCSAWVIPTNEELMIARHTGEVLGLINAPA